MDGHVPLSPPSLFTLVEVSVSSWLLLQMECVCVQGVQVVQGVQSDDDH